MQYAFLEIITGYIIGLILVVFSCWLFKVKIKGITRLVMNALLGGLLLVIFNLFGIVTLPLNPVNALLTGFLGIFGIVVIFLIVTRA